MDRQTLERLIKNHQADLYRYARFLGADAGTADDVVQDTFLAAAGSVDVPIRNNRPLYGPWLRGIARNVFLVRLRRNRASPITVDSHLVEQAQDVWQNSFMENNRWPAVLEALGKCLESLTEKQRALVDLRYARKKSRREMARQFEMTEDGIKSLLRRVRHALAVCIEKRLSKDPTT